MSPNAVQSYNVANCTLLMHIHDVNICSGQGQTLEIKKVTCSPCFYWVLV